MQQDVFCLCGPSVLLLFSILFFVVDVYILSGDIFLAMEKQKTYDVRWRLCVCVCIRETREKSREISRDYPSDIHWYTIAESQTWDTEAVKELLSFYYNRHLFSQVFWKQNDVN